MILDTERPRWYRHALCHAEGVPTGYFFPSAAETPCRKERARQRAIAIDCCNRCPVRRQCHEHARRSQMLDRDEGREWGIWGGEMWTRDGDKPMRVPVKGWEDKTA